MFRDKTIIVTDSPASPLHSVFTALLPHCPLLDALKNETASKERTSIASWKTKTNKIKRRVKWGDVWKIRSVYL